jgi:hypothetical protein
MREGFIYLAEIISVHSTKDCVRMCGEEEEKAGYVLGDINPLKPKLV